MLPCIILSLLSILSAHTFLSTPLNHKSKEVIKLQEGDENCLTPTYELYPEAAIMWKDSWINLHQEDTSDELRVLKAADLLELSQRQKGEDPNAEGLRFYYGLPDNTTEVPELVIVNTLNCKDLTGEGEIALLVTPKGSEKISMKDAAVYTHRWQLRRSRSEKTSVHAYNYRWDQITKLVGTDIDKDMKIEYGLRTLSPDENQTEFEPADKNSDGDVSDVKYGSIIYVNVLSVVSKELLAEDEDGQLDNFARPCPRYCDPDSTVLINYSYY